jgi:hypothetical protein
MSSPRRGASSASDCVALQDRPVKGALSGRVAQATPNRPRRQVQNDEYGAFVRRVLRAYSRRVGDGDVEALVLLVDLAEEIDTAMAEAVMGLRAHGYSWAEIGVRLSISRQAAQQRWGVS